MVLKDGLNKIRLILRQNNNKLYDTEIKNVILS